MERVLITGASSGLGRGLAELYGASGAHVGLLARREEQLHDVAHVVAERGGRAWVRAVDVTATEEVERAVNDFALAAGGLDVVIANAGIGEGRRGERFDVARVAEVFRVNVIGLTNTLLPALAILQQSERGGVLVGMSSVAGFRAMPGSLAYSSSKAAVLTFIEGLQMELRGTPVHAMALCPGFVRTPLTDRNDFSMPFLIECDDACRRMKRAIDARKDRYVFPLPMAVAALLLRNLPREAVRRLVPSKRHPSSG